MQKEIWKDENFSWWCFNTKYDWFFIDTISDITDTDTETNIDSPKINNIKPMPISENSIFNEETDKTLNEIIDDIDSLVKRINNSQIYERKSNGYIIKKSSINNSNYEYSSTYINFSYCENNLLQNNIPPDAVLKVVMIEL